MKRILISLFMMVSLLMPALAAQPAFADNVIHTCAGGVAASTDVCKGYNAGSGSNPVVHLIKGAITILAYIVGIAAVLGLIINGIKYMVARGDSQAVATARNGIIYSMVGVVVTACAATIVSFVLSKY